jgi:nucleoside-diphosphate-sugar epimerase
MELILVTGASGFVGGHIVPVLRARGMAVRCLVRPSSRVDMLHACAAEIALGDVGEPETLERALVGVDAVVHCAGLTKARSRGEFFRVNVEGVQNLYSACMVHRHRIRKIVHVGSLAALGPASAGKPVTEESPPHPISNYGASKLSGQLIAESHMDRLPISIIIPPAVYGPGDVDFLIYFKLVSRGWVPVFGRGPHSISAIYVADLAEAIVRVLLSEQTTGRSYLVSDGCEYSWTDIAEAIGTAMNRKPRYLYLPAAAGRMLGLLGDMVATFTGEPMLISSQRIRDFLQVSWVCSARRICEELGYVVRHPLAVGVRETLDWYRANNML